MVMITSRDRNFRCCFSLHVRTGTLVLGGVQILLHLLAITFLMLMAMNPDLLRRTIVNTTISKDGKISVSAYDQRPFLTFVLLIPSFYEPNDVAMLPPDKVDPIIDPEPKAMSLHLSGSDQNQAVFSDVPTRTIIQNLEEKEFAMLHDDDGSARDERTSKSMEALQARLRKRYQPYFSFCICLFSLGFCCLLVHGAYAYQPAQILPYFFLQLFDFVINLLTVVGYLSSSADARLHRMGGDNANYANIPPSQPVPMFVALLTLSIFCLVLLFKAYCLCLVWDCYKYVVLEAANQESNGLRRGGGGRSFSGTPPSIWSLFGLQAIARGNNDFGHFPLSTLPTPVYDANDDLPKYEEAMNTPINQFGPPPYVALPVAASQATTAAPVDVTPASGGGSSDMPSSTTELPEVATTTTTTLGQGPSSA